MTEIDASRLPGIEVVDGSVYHYTGSTPLISMLQTREFWASEAKTLNDLEEVRYGWRLIDKWLGRQTYSRGIELIETALNYRDDRSWNPSTYILCASLDPDDSFQWRLYGDDLAGYAVEIDTSIPLCVRASPAIEPPRRETYASLFEDYVRDAASVTPWMKVLYRPRDVYRALDGLREILDAAADDLRITLLSKDSETAEELRSEGEQILHGEALGTLETIAALTKATGFRSEREARVVVSLPFDRSTHVEMRAGRYGVTPYVRLCARPESATRVARVVWKEEIPRLPFRSVRLGPAHRKEAKQAILALFEKHGFSGTGADVAFPVRRSRVPVR